MGAKEAELRRFIEEIRAEVVAWPRWMRNVKLMDKDRQYESVKEQPMNEKIKINIMRNVWDEHGAWRGVQRNTRCFTPGWTYELIPESEYPEMPIEDGVYRVEIKTNNSEGFECVLLDRINGMWLYANGNRSYANIKIIEKYKRVK